MYVFVCCVFALLLSSQIRSCPQSFTSYICIHACTQRQRVVRSLVFCSFSRFRLLLYRTTGNLCCLDDVSSNSSFFHFCFLSTT